MEQGLLGNTIRQARIDNNMTQEQLASQMGVMQNVVSNWENEVALPRVRQLPELARILQCTIGALFEIAEE